MLLAVTGNELKERRQALGLSQEKLAHALGVTGSTVARLEQLRERDVPTPQLYDLALKQLEAERKKK